MNLSKMYRNKKQSKAYTWVAVIDVISLAASFLIILNAM